jgi:peptidoglycan/LPS O-acetylase OafA/YrhL
MDRIKRLDGLRGIAILWVIAYHYLKADPNVAQIPIVSQVVRFGWIGVTLFFSLSGFLITQNLIDTRGRDDYYRSFLWKRGARLLPLYIILLAFAVFEPSFGMAGSVPFWTHFLFVQNFAMAEMMTLGQGSLRVTWSLAVEVQYYVLVMFLVRLVPVRRLTLALMLLVILSVGLRLLLRGAGFGETALVVLMPCRIDSFAMGGLVALIPLPFTSILGIGLLSACIFAAFANGVFGEYTSTFIPFYYTILAVSCASAVGLCVSGGRFLHVLESKALVNCGRTSYFLYLFHLPVALACHYAVKSDALDAGVKSAIVAFCVCWGLANLSMKYIEAPIMLHSKSRTGHLHFQNAQGGSERDVPAR